jgi:putative ABC transport system substrate-binding protein
MSRVHRRQLVIAAAALLAMPLVVRAQPARRVYRIGLLGVYSDNAAVQRVFGEFREAMAALGWQEGENYVRVDRWAMGDLQRLPALASELVSLKPDALMAGTPESAFALKNATRTIPIVAIGIPDPVEIGLARSLAHSGENVTGPTAAFSELIGKQLEVLKEAIPRVARIAALNHTGSPSRGQHIAHALTAAAALRVRLEPIDVSTPKDFEPAFERIRAGGAEAVLVVPSPFMFVNRAVLAEIALRYRLPTIWNIPAQAEAGGLMSYGVDVNVLFRRAAVFMDSIFRGASAADLPFERPSKFELVLNMKTAKALGMSFPQSLLLRADRVIE